VQTAFASPDEGTYRGLNLVDGGRSLGALSVLLQACAQPAVERRVHVPAQAVPQRQQRHLAAQHQHQKRRVLKAIMQISQLCVGSIA